MTPLNEPRDGSTAAAEQSRADARNVAPSHVAGPRRQFPWLLRTVRRWLEGREEAFVGRKCGGDQRCPWCKQWVNHYRRTNIRDFPDGFLDEIYCGNCTGTSLWKWDLGFFYVTHGSPPFRPQSDFKGEFIKHVIANARLVVDARPPALPSDGPSGSTTTSDDTLIPPSSQEATAP